MTNLHAQLQDTLGTAYTLDRELGGGGMSRVFLAEENALGRKVVVKVLPPELVAGVNVDRFKREIQVAARLQHAHIVPVLSAGEMDGIPYYTMPFVAGESLRARVGRDGALPMTEAIGVLRDVAKALAYAHEQGVVHRDIKPDNVMLAGGSAMVVDFGIAKAISASRTNAPGGTLTQIGTAIGTPAYMAPEQAAGDPATDHRADIYSFGCLAYEILAGRPPFTATSPQRLLAAHMGETPEPLANLRPDTPASLAALVQQCLEKDADKRPESALEIVHSVDNVTSGGGHTAMPAILVGGPGMVKKALGAWVAGLIVVAIVAKAAIVGIGLPEWVLPGAMIVMALGIPVILFTAYVHHTARRLLASTPQVTPGGGSRIAQGTMQTLALKASPHMSWRRTTLGGAWAVGGFVLLVGAFMVLRAMGIGPAGSLLAAGKISSREPLVVTDFKVTNADSTLGRVLSDAAKAQLSQSSVITLLSPEGVAAALRRMQRPPSSALDLALARELALRNDIKGVIDGEINGLGAGGYIVTMKLVTADSARELASFRETAKDAAGLIATVDKLARDLRGKVGESLKRVNASPPLERATTASLDALRKYTEGARAEDLLGKRREAIALLREAVQIDSTFAQAWRKLGIVLANAGEPRSESDPAFAQAYRYRDRLPELHRDFITGNYFGNGPGRDRAKAIAAYEAILRRGDTAGVAVNLGLQLVSRREFAHAESLYKAHERHAPGTFRPNYGNLAAAQLRQQKFAAFDSTLDLGVSRFSDLALDFRRRRIDLLYLKGDTARFRRAVDSAYANGDSAGKVWVRPRAWGQALVDGRLGLWRARFTEGRGDTASAPPRARLSWAADETDALVTAVMQKRPADVAHRIDAALENMSLTTLPSQERPYLTLATSYSYAGRPDKARAMLARRDAELDTAVLRETAYLRSEALGEILLAEHKGAEAVAEFRRSDRRDDGPSRACTLCLPISLARAFDMAGEVDSAITYYRQSVSMYSVDRMASNFDATILALYSKRLGELYEERGDKENAARQYLNFVNLWKNADAELQPQVAEVKRRLARLSDIERPPARD